MQSEGFGVEIVSDATHLHCKFSVPRAAVCVWWSEESNGVVSLLDDKHSDDFLVAVYDEVPSELVGVFVKLDQFLLAETSQVTAVGSDHNGDLSKWGCEGVGIAINLPGDDAYQRSWVCFTGHSALLGVDFLFEDGGVIATEWFSELDVGESQLEGLEGEEKLLGLVFCL